MITNHDDFVSAYVVNMLCMPLQLVTGALAVHSASYHVGPNGFEYVKLHVLNNMAFLLMLSAHFFKSNQISLFLTQLQLQQNELKLNTQNAQLKAGKKI